jgi:hypothetical protein
MEPELRPVVRIKVAESETINVSKKLFELGSVTPNTIDISEQKINRDVKIGLHELLPFFEYHSTKEIKEKLDTHFSGMDSETLESFTSALKACHLRKDILDSVYGALVYILDDSNMRGLYPQCDIEFFKQIKQMLGDVSGTGSEIKEIPIHEVTLPIFQKIMTLLRYCLICNDFNRPEVSAQLHYEQRKAIHTFLNAARLGDKHLCHLIRTLNYLDAPAVLLKAACKECANRIKEQTTLKEFSILDTLSDVVQNHIKPFFVDPILMYMKGLAPIMCTDAVAQVPFSFDEETSFSSHLPHRMYQAHKKPIIVFYGECGAQSALYCVDLSSQTPNPIRLVENPVMNPLSTGVFNNEATVIAYNTRTREGGVSVYLLKQDKKSSIPIISDIEPTCCVFGSDDKELIIGYKDGTIAIYDTDTRERKANKKCHEQAISALACHPDDSSMIVFIANNEVWIVYAEKDTVKGDSISLNKEERLFILIGTEDIRCNISDICFSSNGDHIVAVGEVMNGVFIFPKWDAITFSLSFPLPSLAVEYKTRSYDTYGKKLRINGDQYTLLFNFRRPLDTSDYVSDIAYFNCSDTKASLIGHFITDSFTSHGLLSKFSFMRPKNGTDMLIRSSLDFKNCSSIVPEQSQQFGNKRYMFSAFASNEEAVYIRSGVNYVEKRMLYEDKWISFFKQFQAYPFSLKELHALHRNFSSLLPEKKQNIDDFLKELAQGLDKDVHTFIVERGQKTQSLKQKQPPVIATVANPEPVLLSPAQPQFRFQAVWSKIISFQNWMASKLPSITPQVQPAIQPQAQYQLPLALAEAEGQQPEENEPVNEATAQEQHAPAVGPVGRIFNGIMSVIRRTMGWLRNIIGSAFT